MIQRVRGSISLKESELNLVTFGFNLSNLLHVSLQGTELGKDLFVHQVIDILDVVVGLVHLLQLFGGFSGIDTLQDAQSSEIL